MKYAAGDAPVKADERMFMLMLAIIQSTNATRHQMFSVSLFSFDIFTGCLGNKFNLAVGRRPDESNHCSEPIREIIQ